MLIFSPEKLEGSYIIDIIEDNGLRHAEVFINKEDADERWQELKTMQEEYEAKNWYSNMKEQVE